jgi:hypothetical protein
MNKIGYSAVVGDWIDYVHFNSICTDKVTEVVSATSGRVLRLQIRSEESYPRIINAEDVIAIYAKDFVPEGVEKMDRQRFDEKGKPVDDMVNHPKHYTFGKIEVITVIDDWQLGFYEGQVVKYVGRAKHKGNELEDLKKAQWYLNRRIEQLQKENK